MQWIGAVILVISSYFMGIKISRREGEALIALNSLIELLEFTQRRIALSLKPLYAIFSDYNNSYLTETGFLDLLRNQKNDPSSAWSAACALLPISEDSLIELQYLGGELGALPLEEQEKRLNACLSALKTERDTLRGSLPQKQKSIRTVSLLLGALGAIILL